MQIIVLIKQVPARECSLRISGDGMRLEQTGVTYETNGPDMYALEAALQLREKVGGEVVVLCAGPERVGQAIREALAKGADRGIHVQLPDATYWEPFALGTAIASALQSEGADLLLTGLQAEDDCQGQLGVVLAELLGFRHATIVTELTTLGDSVRVRKELENGRYQYVTLPLPAALSIQSGSTKPRLATMMGIKQARSKAVRVETVSEPLLQDSHSAQIRRVYPPLHQDRAEILTGDPRASASRLLEQLRFEARLL